MRFTEEEKLTISAEDERTGVKTVCATYDISDQTYRDWRYRALGIKPRKHLSSAKRLRVLKKKARGRRMNISESFRVGANARASSNLNERGGSSGTWMPANSQWAVTLRRGQRQPCST
jgi:hypothetical protein